MFDSAELGHKINKETYAIEEPALRDALLEVQAEALKEARFSIVIVIAGVDGAGKGETANLLSEWFDPRHVRTHALAVPAPEHVGRPELYAAWSALPSKGKIAVFAGSWYTRPMLDRLDRRIDKLDFERQMRDARSFETMLANENVLVLKFWLHLSKRVQAKNFRALEASKLTRWRVTSEDWERHATYTRFRAIAERTIRLTSTAEAPWTIVDASDRQFRALTVGKTILAAMKEHLATPAKGPAGPRMPPRMPSIDKLDLLGSLDLESTVDKEKYDVELEQAQGELNRLFRTAQMKDRAVVCVFEGADAAGKGGAIRRVAASLDARQFRIVPIAAPTAEERAHPYLWRFWAHVPKHGQMTIFDRSWYGRVLVERVEKFCPDDDWQRAYAEINDFEDQLSSAGIIVMKFWLQISDEEQLKRFQEREKTPFKRFKIGPDDWRNREKSAAYRDAANEMFERTSTELSPWTLVEANDKRHARLKVLRTICDRVDRIVRRR